MIWFSWQIELAKILLENGQSHLFQQWPELGVDDKEKLAFFDQVFSLCFFSYISVFWWMNVETGLKTSFWNENVY